MARKYDELRKKIPVDRRRATDEKVQQTLGRMLVRELRRAAGMTQEQLAQALGIAQPNVSKLEHRDDITLGTLRRLVEACGGELSFAVRLPSGTIRFGPGDPEHGATLNWSSVTQDEDSHSSPAA